MKRYYYITDEDYATAEKNGIKKDCVNSRVRRLGWDVDRSITQPTRKRYEVPEEMWKEAEKAGLTKNQVACRLYAGWTIEEACTKPIKKGRQRLYPDWVYEKAKENGISHTCLNHRCKRGWNLLSACTTPVIKDKFVKKS